MDENGGVYVLLGSKPMIEFGIDPLPNEEEKKVIYEAKSELFRKHIPLTTFHPNREDCRKLWEDWKGLTAYCVSSSFLFLECENHGYGFFIHIPKTVEILKTYQADFEQVIGSPIDPETLVYQFGNDKNPQWRKILSSHYLMGLLYGFGEKNALNFARESRRRKHFPTRHRASIGNVPPLPFPGFISYESPDPQVEKYEKEREMILEFFKDKDFTETTLRLLKE